MNAFFDRLVWIAVHILENSWQAAVLMAVVVLATLLLRERLSARWRAALWLLVVARLLMPVTLESPISLFNLLPAQLAKATTDAEPPTDAMPVDVASADASWSQDPYATNFSERTASFPSGGQNVDSSGTPALTETEPIVLEEEHSSVAPLSTAQVVWRSVVSVWLLGTAVLLLRMVLLTLRLHLLLRRCFSLTLSRSLRRSLKSGSESGIGSAYATPIPAWEVDKVLAIFEAAQRELGIRRRVALLVSPSSVGPAVTGIFRPRLILAESLLTKLSSDELRLVFLHELSHVRRQDLLVQRLWQFAEVLHWFNPVVWLAARRWQTDRELACDEAVLARLDRAHRASYGHAILRVMESLSTLSPVPGAVGVLMRRGFLTARIQKIATYRPLSRRWTALAVILLLLLIPLGLTNAVGDSQKPLEPEKVTAVTEEKTTEVAEKKETPPTDENTAEVDPQPIPAQTVTSSLHMSILRTFKGGGFLPIGQTPGKVDIPECEDRCFELIGLTPDNVDDYKKEIRRLDIQRIGLPILVTNAQLKKYHDAGLFNGITSLKLYGYKENPSKPTDLSCLSDLQDLKTLTLDTFSDSADLSPLSKLQGLTTLYLHGCYYAKDASAFSRIPNLKTLGLYHCRKFSDASGLAQLEGLKELLINDCDNLTDISGLAQLGSLESLELRRCDKLDAEDFSCLPKIKNLRSLTLESTALDDPAQDLSFISKLKDLESLTLSMPGFATNAPFLSGLEKLKHLNVIGTGKLTDLSAVSELKGLETFSVYRSGITNLDFLRDHPKLAEVRVYNCPHLTGIFTLAGCKNLKLLDLGWHPEIKQKNVQWLRKQLPNCKIRHTNSETVAEDTESGRKKPTILTGRCLDEHGNPVAGAYVTVIGYRKASNNSKDQGGPYIQFLAGTLTSRNGGYRIYLPNVSSELYHETVVTARADGTGLAWKKFNPDNKAVHSTFVLLGEKPIRGRLLDKQGKPVAGMRLAYLFLLSSSSSSALDGQLILGLNQVDQISRKHPKHLPQPVTTDEQGRFVIHGIAPRHGVALEVKGDERFAVQSFTIDTEQAKKRSHIISGRPPTKNVKPGEEAVITLKPSKFIEGVVRCEDTGQPVPHAVVQVWASQQERLGPMYYVTGKTDAEGKYRIIPRPGIRFGVNAYPPKGVPYLPKRSKEIFWYDDSRTKQMDLTVPCGVLVRGTVVDEKSKQPLAGAPIRYYAAEKNTFKKKDVILSGRQNAKYSDENGRFELAVLPGQGYLFSYRPGQEFFPEEINSRLFEEKRVWYRNHGIIAHKLDLKPGDKPVEMELPILCGEKVSGQLVDADGKSIQESLVFSWQNTPPSFLKSPGYPLRKAFDGRFELSGLMKNETYPVYFLDQKNRLGATALLKAGEKPTITLQPCGQAKATFVTPDGKPFADFTPAFNIVVALPGIYLHNTLQAPATRGTSVAASAGGDEYLVANIDRVNYRFSPRTDKEGNITFPALIPGANYRLLWHDLHGKVSSKDFTVSPGETLNLGKLVANLGKPKIAQPKPSRPDQDPAMKKPNQSQTPDPDRADGTTITGRCVDEQGNPIAGAYVTAIGCKKGSYWGKGKMEPQLHFLAGTLTSRNGGYRMHLSNVSSKSHLRITVLARANGTKLAAENFDPDIRAGNSTLVLLEETPIHGRLLDEHGKPAAGVQLKLCSISSPYPKSRTGEQFLDLNLEDQFCRQHPERLPQPTTTDKQGRFVIHGTPSQCRVVLEVVNSDRFAPQSLIINSGMPDLHASRKTPRNVVSAPPRKRETPKIKPGEEAEMTLQPAKILELVVRGDDNKPIPQATVNIRSSQSEAWTSNKSLTVSGKTDANGRVRIIPRPGICFYAEIYPPEGVPYLWRAERNIIWKDKSRTKQVEVILPRGILVRGKVTDSKSKEPIAGATIYYQPEGRNSFNKNDVITGWTGTLFSDKNGRFEIPVLPGRGRLIARGPSDAFVLKEIGSLPPVYNGNPGWRREYANAVQSLDLKKETESFEVNLSLDRGEKVTGRVVDQDGEPIEKAIILSRLKINPTNLYWRGYDLDTAFDGRFELVGLAKDQAYPVYFLDAKNRLGAAVTLKSGDTPTVTLRPCGQANATFVDLDGKPLADYMPCFEIVMTPGSCPFDFEARRRLKDTTAAADQTSVSSIENTNYRYPHMTNKEGNITFPALIPGATYRLYRRDGMHTRIHKEFTVSPGETVELGKIATKEYDGYRRNTQSSKPSKPDQDPALKKTKIASPPVMGVDKIDWSPPTRRK